MARIKKAQGGEIIPISRSSSPKVSLRQGQYKRLGRLSAKDPSKAEDVAKRMVERRSRKARGQEFLKKNVSKLYPSVPEIQKKGGKVKKAMDGMTTTTLAQRAARAARPGMSPESSRRKSRASLALNPMMKKGGSFPDLNKDGKVTKKDILIGKGVLPKTAKKGTALKKQAATAIAMKKAGKAPKKMMGGGKCRGGCY